MERATSSVKSDDSAGFSDEELIRRYCADPPDEHAGEVLLGRSMPRMQTTLRKLVHGKSSICPEWYSRDIFLEDAVSTANEKLFRGIKTFNFECAFEGWLATIAKNAALDVRRKLVGRGSEPNPRPEPVETLTDADVFRSKYWVDPSLPVSDREMREIVRKLLVLHLEHAPDDRESADAIASYWLEDRPVKDIAETFGCSERSVWRLFRHDYPELKELALGKFGIAKFSDL